MTQSKDRRTAIDPVAFSPGSGNVFEDLGLPRPEEALAKARLADGIADTIQRRGLSQIEAGALLGIDQPKVSRIVNGRRSSGSLTGFAPKSAWV